MAIRDIFKISRKTFFDPTGWADVDGFKATNRTLWGTVSGLFTPAAPVRRETFDRAVERLGLTKKEIKNMEITYTTYAYSFALFGLMTLIFSFYLLFYHLTFSGLLLGFASTALFFVQAFRFHFWAFQIKHHKLGCTFKEWRSGKVTARGAKA